MSATRHASRAPEDRVAPQGRSLRTAMRENAVFSGIAGLTLVLGARSLDDWIGVRAWMLVVLGVGLVVYAFELVWLTTAPNRLRLGGRIAVTADVAWVIAALALVSGTDALTRSGKGALIAVTAVVAGMAAAQWMGLRRLRDSRR